MKRTFTLLTALSFISILNFLNAQTYVYNFNGDFTEAGGVGPTLTEVLTCGATAGSFGTQNITTSSGTCGASAQTTFDFNAGGGLEFDNSAALIWDTYTINILFEFNALVGSQRVLDFRNGLIDQGIYTDGGCLQLHPVGTFIGTCPNVVANQFTLLSLVRDGATNDVTLYVDGAPFETYNDVVGIYVPVTTTSPIRFFLDDVCEVQAGSIKLLTLTATTSTDQEILDTWNNLCATILPLRLVNFNAHKQNNSVVLNWTTASEANISHFELERSSMGNNFSKLSEVPARNTSGTNSYSYIDKQPFSGTGFYRIKMVDMDGGFKYSAILKISFSGPQRIEVYPNPVKNILTVSGIKNGEKLKILNTEGKELFRTISLGESITLDIGKYPSGLYYLQYFDGERVQNKKIIKN